MTNLNHNQRCLSRTQGITYLLSTNKTEDIDSEDLLNDLVCLLSVSLTEQESRALIRRHFVGQLSSAILNMVVRF